jgi:hypothetical protein
MLKRTLLLTTMILAFLFAGNCLWMSPSHACCQKAPLENAKSGCAGHSEKPGICCVAQPLPASQSSLNIGFWIPEFPTATVQNTVLTWFTVIPSQTVALQHQQFVKDQSKRYLELGVLLS